MSQNSSSKCADGSAAVVQIHTEEEFSHIRVQTCVTLMGFPQTSVAESNVGHVMLGFHGCSSVSQKGKLREVASILGSPLDLRPELYNNDPWVEFIDLDIEETTNRPTGLDPDCLKQTLLSSNCAPPNFNFRDDDSGRASCCEPDLSSEAEASNDLPVTPSQALSHTFCSVECVNQSPDASKTETLGRETLYTQVSEVKSTGKVLLSPESEKSSSKDMPLENGGKDLHSLVVTRDTGELCDNLYPFGSRSHESDTTSNYPAPAYTVVDGVNGQNSLLLTTNSTSALQLIIPKSAPAPTGYLTPDLLGSVTP